MPTLPSTCISYILALSMSLFFVFSEADSIDTSVARLIRVDQSGKGDHAKVQDAIDSVPSNNSEVVFIWVKPGVYREKIVVPLDKSYITLSGTQGEITIITWEASGEIIDSATFSVFASDFVGRYLTIQNTYGVGGKAVALRVSGDRAAFFGCRILSYQDTLFDDSGRHYYRNCCIEGAIYFIFGEATSLFEIFRSAICIPSPTTLEPSRRRGGSPHRRIFWGCTITGTKKTVLGRPWGAYSRVIFAFTYMPGAVQPHGWDDWGLDSSKQSTVYYGEYRCYGPGAARSKRVSWSKELTNLEAEPFLTKDLIGGNSWIRDPSLSSKPSSSNVAINN